MARCHAAGRPGRAGQGGARARARQGQEQRRRRRRPGRSSISPSRPRPPARSASSRPRPRPIPRTSRRASTSPWPIGPASQKQEAIDELLAMIKLDRNWNEEAARQQLLKFFEALGFTDPLAVDGRKRLSTILFSVSRLGIPFDPELRAAARDAADLPVVGRAAAAGRQAAAQHLRAALSRHDLRFAGRPSPDRHGAADAARRLCRRRPAGRDGKPKVHKVGCAGRIVSFNETEDGRLLLALSGVCRFEIVPRARAWRRAATAVSRRCSRPTAPTSTPADEPSSSTASG